ncbi:hypothetical protein GCM10023196_063730 [Actinoallomurus vinaceus]|uniref:Uncharacterized protein n=1 Tax=Actinoallomurus vinaceus TaxID=1080074 RepID=A0ABP8UIM8_9ACTN
MTEKAGTGRTGAVAATASGRTVAVRMDARRIGVAAATNAVAAAHGAVARRTDSRRSGVAAAAASDLAAAERTGRSGW